jgi:hypothetical protein
LAVKEGHCSSRITYSLYQGNLRNWIAHSLVQPWSRMGACYVIHGLGTPNFLQLPVCPILHVLRGGRDDNHRWRWWLPPWFLRRRPARTASSDLARSPLKSFGSTRLGELTEWSDRLHIVPNSDVTHPSYDAKTLRANIMLFGERL